MMAFIKKDERNSFWRLGFELRVTDKSTCNKPAWKAYRIANAGINLYGLTF
jgi:hypothetical protein